jgi:hypothetical protein
MTDVWNRDAYEAAIKRYIRGNANKTRRANWFAANPDGQRLHDWLFQTGEFEGSPLIEGMYSGNFGSFLLTMRDSFLDWGAPSEKQTEIIRSALSRKEKWVVESEKRKEAQHAADSLSQHVGEVGKRLEFNLNIKKVLSFDTQFGMTYIHLMRDDAGNVIVYKGSNDLSYGGTEIVNNMWERKKLTRVTVKATVKEHGEREGIKQTVISRPKIISNE